MIKSLTKRCLFRGVIAIGAKNLLSLCHAFPWKISLLILIKTTSDMQISYQDNIRRIVNGLFRKAVHTFCGMRISEASSQNAGDIIDIKRNPITRLKLHDI